MITQENKRDFFEKGYFVCRRQFDAARLEAIGSEIDRLHIAAITEVQKHGAPARIEETKSRFFQWQVHVASSTINDLLYESCYLNACRCFQGDNVDLFTGLAAVKGAEAGKEFPWHQDTAYAVTKPLHSLVTWTAIDRATRENGCLQVIPGSHREGLRRHCFDEISIATARLSQQEKQSAVALELDPGDVAVFSSLLLHKTGENTTMHPRRALVFQFHSPHVVLEHNGQPVGDQHPILRSGNAFFSKPRKGKFGVDKHL